MKKSFPFHRQLDAMDCGLACLRMVTQHHGRHYSSQSLRQQSGLSREGVSLLGISRVAEDLGLHSLGVKLDPDTLLREAPLLAILHWRQNHFVVLYRADGKGIHLADPAHGRVTLTRKD